MSTTFGDLMSEYEHMRDGVKRFGTWNNLDTFVERLINQVAVKPVKQNTAEPQQQFGFDDMGSVVPVNHD